jgi:hypothetical protein
VRYCAGAVLITTELSKRRSLVLKRIHEAAQSHLAFGQELDISAKYKKLQCDMKYIHQAYARNTMKSKLDTKVKKEGNGIYLNSVTFVYLYFLKTKEYYKNHK